MTSLFLVVVVSIKFTILSYSDVRPVTPTEDKEKIKRHAAKIPERKVIVTGDTDLFLKHLFAGVADHDKKTVSQLKRGR